jgi:hypothetical protein
MLHPLPCLHKPAQQLLEVGRPQLEEAAALMQPVTDEPATKVKTTSQNFSHNSCTYKQRVPIGSSQQQRTPDTVVYTSATADRCACSPYVILAALAARFIAQLHQLSNHCWRKGLHQHPCTGWQSKSSSTTEHAGMNTTRSDKSHVITCLKSLLSENLFSDSLQNAFARVCCHSGCKFDLLQVQK